MTIPTLSFWFRLPEGSEVPSYAQVQEAWQEALPGWHIDYTVSHIGGNPRDGYLHPVDLVAQSGDVTVKADLGGFGSFGPEMDADAVYELHGFAVRVTGHTREDGEGIRQRVVAAFTKLGYEDAGMLV